MSVNNISFNASGSIRASSSVPSVNFFPEWKKACETGDVSKLKDLLNEPGFIQNINARVGLTSITTPLRTFMRAAPSLTEKDVNEILALLLEKGADVDYASLDGKTPLMLACRWLFPSTVQILLAKRPRCLVTDESGNNAMHYALANRNCAFELFQKLHIAEPRLLTEKNYNESNLFHVLCKATWIPAEHRCQIADALIEAKVSCFEKNSSQEIPLTAAVPTDPTDNEDRFFQHLMISFQFHPLHVACIQNDIERVRSFLQESVSQELLSVQTLPTNYTPLHLAGLFNRLEIFVLLLKNKANPNVLATGGSKAFYLINTNNNKDVPLLRQYFFNAGGSVVGNARDKENAAAELMACSSKSLFQLINYNSDSSRFTDFSEFIGYVDPILRKSLIECSRQEVQGIIEFILKINAPHCRSQAIAIAIWALDHRSDCDEMRDQLFELYLNEPQDKFSDHIVSSYDIALECELLIHSPKMTTESIQKLLDRLKEKKGLYYVFSPSTITLLKQRGNQISERCSSRTIEFFPMGEARDDLHLFEELRTRWYTVCAQLGEKGGMLKELFEQASWHEKWILLTKIARADMSSDPFLNLLSCFYKKENPSYAPIDSVFDAFSIERLDQWLKQEISPLHLACIHNDLNQVKALLEAPGGQELLESKIEPENYTALHLSALLDHEEITAFLLQRGANPNAAAGTSCLTPYELFIQNTNKRSLHFQHLKRCFFEFGALPKSAQSQHLYPLTQELTRTELMQYISSRWMLLLNSVQEDGTDESLAEDTNEFISFIAPMLHQYIIHGSKKDVEQIVAVISKIPIWSCRSYALAVVLSMLYQRHDLHELRDELFETYISQLPSFPSSHTFLEFELIMRSPGLTTESMQKLIQQSPRQMLFGKLDPSTATLDLLQERGFELSTLSAPGTLPRAIDCFSNSSIRREIELLDPMKNNWDTLCIGLGKKGEVLKKTFDKGSWFEQFLILTKITAAGISLKTLPKNRSEALTCILNCLYAKEPLFLPSASERKVTSTYECAAILGRLPFKVVEKWLKDPLCALQVPSSTCAAYQTLLEQAGVDSTELPFFCLSVVHDRISQDLSTSQVEHSLDTPLDLKLPEKWLTLYFKLMAEHPEVFKKTFNNFFQLLSIEVRTNGQTKATWAPILHQYFSACGSTLPSSVPSSKFEEKLSALLSAPYPEISPMRLEEIAGGPWDFIRNQGRTALYQNAQGKWLAIKLQKKDEALDALFREDRIVSFFNSSAAECLKTEHSPNGLLTKWPTPLGVVEMTGDSEYQGVENRASNKAYLYTFDDESYFKYLHNPELSEEAFSAARKMMVHDLFLLARHGFWYTALADLFHTVEEDRGADLRPDRGKYLPLPDLFRDDQNSSGSGRLDQIEPSIEYPNARASGLADPDADFMRHLLDLKFLRSQGMHQVHQMGRRGLLLFLQAHYTACYLLVDQLILGRRYRSTFDWQDPEKVEKLSELLIDDLTIAIATYNDLPEEKVRPMVQQFFDAHQAALQMQFFVSENREKNYVPHIKALTLPEEIFQGKGTSGNPSEFRGWQEGFYADGIHQDSGPVNGPHCQTDNVRGWYLSSFFMTVLNFTEARRKKWAARVASDPKASSKHRLYSMGPVRTTAASSSSAT